MSDSRSLGQLDQGQPPACARLQGVCSALRNWGRNISLATWLISWDGAVPSFRSEWSNPWCWIFDPPGDESCFKGVVAKTQQRAFGSQRCQGCNQNQKCGVEGKGHESNVAAETMSNRAADKMYILYNIMYTDLLASKVSHCEVFSRSDEWTSNLPKRKCTRRLRTNQAFHTLARGGSSWREQTIPFPFAADGSHLQPSWVWGKGGRGPDIDELYGDSRNSLFLIMFDPNVGIGIVKVNQSLSMC